MEPSNETTHAFTVDVEEWFNLHSADIAPYWKWDELESHVVRQTDAILALLEETDTSGTFFILGWVAQRHPELVTRIADAGHEIGCHSHRHPLVYELSPDEFRDDLKRAISAIGEAAGRTPTLYRAPSFSVTDQCVWFFDCLAEEGITVDSSICPAVRHDSGMESFGETPQTIDTPHGTLRESPVSTFRVGPLRFGSLGGGYFRLLPKSLVGRQLERLAAQDLSAVFYIHPYDIDPDQPRRLMGPVAYFRKYVGLRRARAKLEELLREYDFAPLGETLSNESGRAA